MDIIQCIYNFVTNKVNFQHRSFAFWLNTKHNGSATMALTPLIRPGNTTSCHISLDIG